VRLPEESEISGVVLADQIKSLDWRARQVEFAASAPDEVVLDVLAKLATLVQP
jgi:mRNA interferase MazF